MKRIWCIRRSSPKSRSYISALKAAQGAKKKQKGTTCVEFAIVSTLFFLLLFSMMDFALYGFVNLTMQHAVREGARYAITGRADLDPEDESNRTAAIKAKIRSSSFGVVERVVDIDDIRVTNSNGQPVSGFGAPGEAIVIRLDCSWPSLNPFIAPNLTNGAYSFSVSAAMTNEAFPGAAP